MEETKKKGSGTTDLTVGRPLTRILQFALPLVLGTLFQQLYSFVDTIIVGRCIGTDALGAVGTTYSLNFMIVGFVLATCNGFGIPVAESFGAKDRDDLHKYLFNGAVLCVVMSLVFAVVTTLIAAPLLQLIHTPAELLENAVRYIRIIFLGIPATVLYNYSSTVLRSLGDSKHPFYFLLVSSFLNIALDVLFIVPLGMGVEGAEGEDDAQPARQWHPLHLVVLHQSGGHPLHQRELRPFRQALQAAGLHRLPDGF